MASPKYRIFIVPERLDKAPIDTRSLAVEEILLSPPNLRPDCFGFRGLSKIRLTPEGIEGVGITAEQELTLMKNGYLELRAYTKIDFLLMKKVLATYAFPTIGPQPSPNCRPFDIIFV